MADELSPDERRGMEERWLAAMLDLIGSSSGRCATSRESCERRSEQGVSLGLLADQVRTSGLIGTGAANRDGTIDAGHHAHFRPLGNTPVSLLPKATRAARPEIEPKH